MGRAFEYRRAAKEKRWDRMSKIFPKLGKSITVAARDGGPDPNTNSALRMAIMNAKAQNMPKENIENAIKRASGKEMAEIREINYEGKGPHGVMIFIETATDNSNRTVANLKIYFRKAGGDLLNSGALDFLFQRKSVVEFVVPEGANLEEIELALIDCGLEDLTINEGIGYATGGFSDFGKLTKGVEALHLEIKKASPRRIPTSPVEFSEKEMADIEAFIDRIEDDEDVQAVFTNVA